MMKHAIHLLVAAFVTTALAGCQLYFGEEDNNGSWTYCGEDGYYECWGNDCYWRSASCPSDGGWGSGSGSGGGFECDTDTDCAAGCYCGDGICEEAGFCTQDTDCGAGYVCDESRSSCTPEDQPTTCADDTACATGEYCDGGYCAASCTCTTDADAKGQGFDFCDEARGTCMPGVDPAGDCAGEVTCNLGRPTCPAGQVAMIAEGCYTGECQAIAACGTAPSCSAYGHEADCRNDDSCGVSYTGINCRKPDNSPCTAGDTNCTCQSYQFASCHDNTMPRTVQFDGHTFNIDELTLRN